MPDKHIRHSTIHNATFFSLAKIIIISRILIQASSRNTHSKCELELPDVNFVSKLMES